MPREKSRHPNRSYHFEAGRLADFLHLLGVKSPLRSFAVESPAKLVSTVLYRLRIEIGKDQPFTADPHNLPQIL